MKRKVIAGAAAIAVSIAGAAGVAGAHPVGEPGTPSCHGERVSHGNAPHDPAHGITPKERADILTGIIAEGGPFGEFLESRYGDEVSVAEFHDFVELNCEESA
ncbi:MAG TPA: hypothetical protein VJ804_08900 [Acidimicrobiales bacterium]|nr:hypothetical protein [Acidimicrobiales bacterium]